VLLGAWLFTGFARLARKRRGAPADERGARHRVWGLAAAVVVRRRLQRAGSRAGSRAGWRKGSLMSYCSI
jgi:hypothetical protein